MNLFNELRSQHGQRTVTEVRSFESLERKIARHKNHLVFTLRCKDENIVPSSLRLKCPIRTNRAKDIIEKAEKQLIRERIRSVSYKIKQYEDNRLVKINDLKKAPLNNGLRQRVLQHLAHSRETEYKQTKWRQQSKFSTLQGKKDRSVTTTLDLTGTQLKKWVVNISKYKLTTAEQSVLAKGLNYAITPNKIPTEEFIVATEQACHSMPTAEAEDLRMKIAHTMGMAKLPKPNITKEEKSAIFKLKREPSIMILPADKGKATVVVDKDDYEKQVNTMLSDVRTYGKLKKDPTTKYKSKLVAILQRLKREDKITEAQYKFLYPTAENVPRIYCTPKIHKEGNPYRPIVDYTGSIAYNLSKSLADLLAPLVGTTEHHIKNSTELAEELKTIRMKPDEILVSHDVVSLFTNTPIPESINIIKSRLEADKTLKKRTNLTTDDIIELLTFVLMTTYFKFRDQIYNQKFGAAMGSPVSPIVANLYMEWLETEAIATAPADLKPKLWLRYVDDTLEIIKSGTVQQWTEHLNSIDSTNNIKFTYEEELDQKIPFLDTLIHKREDGSLKLTVYRKK
ncbi:PREDICTED: uncharacterized protein LOC106819296, partial [Priapulus caudatus]|uniref:Uncharacterized protein LOC106819296 n=1 Tax=Priapulus caudatus TaxID=37621 RepID=A0ABM1F4Q7_PRICU